jgi:hypothetical protein
MKSPIRAACVFMALTCATGFGQIEQYIVFHISSGPSGKLSADGKLVSYSIPFGPPSTPVMIIKGEPFSAYEMFEQKRIQPDGTRVTRAAPPLNIYRDSAGRTRTDFMLFPFDMPRIAAEDIPIAHQICDPVSGDVYLLDPANKIAHRHKIPERLRRTPTKKDKKPREAIEYTFKTEKALEEPLRKRKIEGISVEGTRTTTTYAAGVMGSSKPFVASTEAWFSVDLHIAAHVLWKNNHPYLGERTRALKNISQTEPDPSLFQVPSDYKVVDETGPFAIVFPGP